MIVSYSGDAFLARRSARAFLREQGYAAEDVTELGEDLTVDAVLQSAAQMGLFGRHALLLDFDEAFTGQAGVKPRNDTMRALERVPEDAVVVVLDSGATAARQRAYRSLGDHHHQPTPRHGALVRWIAGELARHGIEAAKDVPAALADLFGEDLPAIAAEVQKLAALDERLTADRVREIANRPASRNAFDLIDAAVAGDAKSALEACRSLLAQGEAPPRVMGALMWQFDIVAKCVGLREAGRDVSRADAARRVKASPYAVEKAMAIAAGLDETALRHALETLLTADVHMKSGRDPDATLQLCTVELAGLFAR